MNEKLTTDLHIKSTDKHEYLHLTYFHPDHTKGLIIYYQTLRLSRIGTFENDYICYKYKMELWFL